MLRADLFLLKSHPKHFSLFALLPDGDELLPPSLVSWLLFFSLLRFSIRLLLLVFANIFQKLLDVVVLLYQLFVYILILRHQLLNHVHSVVVPQDAVESCAAVLRVVWVRQVTMVLLVKINAFLLLDQP